MSTLNVCLPLFEYVLCLYVMHQVVYGCAHLVSSAVLGRTYVTYCVVLQHELERLGDHMTSCTVLCYSTSLSDWAIA